MSSDTHEFVGRVFDLSIVDLNFETEAELSKVSHAKYVSDVNWSLTRLVQRVESLNEIGNLLWASDPETYRKNLPIDAYQWLSLTNDAFLMRFASTFDCLLLVANHVYQLGLKEKACTVRNIMDKLGVNGKKLQDLPVSKIQEFAQNQNSLRTERNLRVHQGHTRTFTDDDTTFKIAALFDQGTGGGLIGTDLYGRKIDINISFKEGIVRLQKKFNAECQRLEDDLAGIYDVFQESFERRWQNLLSSA